MSQWLVWAVFWGGAGVEALLIHLGIFVGGWYSVAGCAICVVFNVAVFGIVRHRGARS